MAESQRFYGRPNLLNTSQKLVQYWRYAYRIGTQEPDIREFIARVVVLVTVGSSAFKANVVGYHDSALFEAYDFWLTLEVIGEAPDESGLTDGKFSDQLWSQLNDKVVAAWAS